MEEVELFLPSIKSSALGGREGGREGGKEGRRKESIHKEWRGGRKEGREGRRGYRFPSCSPAARWVVGFIVSWRRRSREKSTRGGGGGGRKKRRV